MCITGELGAPHYMSPNSATHTNRVAIILNVAAYSGKRKVRPRRYSTGNAPAHKCLHITFSQNAPPGARPAQPTVSKG